MSVYLLLFLTFLKIGAVSFGGGYGMISLIREECLANGWLTEDQLLNLVAVSESTPGPIAVNIATFVGSSQAGALGAFLATLGVVLPSFIIILVISALLTSLMKYAGVKAALGGVRPAVVGMILATAITMLLGTVFGLQSPTSTPFIGGRELLLFSVLAAITLLAKKITKKPISPILLILLSGGMGMLLYG